VHSVIESQSEQHAHKLEPHWHFVGISVEPVESAAVFGDEHIEVRVEYLFGDQGEVLIFDSSLVGSFLPNKLNLQGTSQIGLHLAQLLHRVIQDIGPPHSDAEINKPLNAKIPRLEVKLMDEGC